MRSANALLELPQARATVPAGTLVSALLIADLAGILGHLFFPTCAHSAVGNSASSNHNR